MYNKENLVHPKDQRCLDQQKAITLEQLKVKVEVPLVTIQDLYLNEDLNRFGWLVGKPCDKFASKQNRGVFSF